MVFGSLFKGRQQLRTTPPITGTRTLEVGNDHRRFRVTADLEGLVHGL